jgi:hypothetical protein
MPLRSALESNGVFDVLGVQSRFGRRDHGDAAGDDRDHFLSWLSDETPPICGSRPRAGKCDFAGRGIYGQAHELRAAGLEMRGDDSGMSEHLRESANPASSRRPSDSRRTRLRSSRGRRNRTRIGHLPEECEGGGRLAARTRFNLTIERDAISSANDMRSVPCTRGNSS